MSTFQEVEQLVLELSRHLIEFVSAGSGDWSGVPSPYEPFSYSFAAVAALVTVFVFFQ